MASVTWLGSFFAAWWFFNRMIESGKSLYLSYQPRLFANRTSVQTLPILKAQLQSTLFGMGLDNQLYDAFMLADLRVINRREFLLRLALTPLSWVLVFCLMLSILQVNGLFVLALVGVYLIAMSRSGRSMWLPGVPFLVCFSVFLVFFELLLRQQSLLLNLETDLSLVFILADSRPLTWVGILIVSTLLSFVLRLRNWSLIWALFLMVSQASPILGSLAWIFGEHLADGILFWHRTKKFQVMEPGIKSFVATWIAAWILAFIFLLVLQQQIVFWENELSLNGYSRIVEMLIILLLSHVLVTAALLIWGHWASRQKADFEATPFLGSVDWLDQRLVGPSFILLYSDGVAQKIQRLQKQRSEFNPIEWQAVPGPFKKMWEQELKNLQTWSEHSKSLLTSRNELSSVIRF